MGWDEGEEGGGWKEVEWDHCIRVASAAYPGWGGGGRMRNNLHVFVFD